MKKEYKAPKIKAVKVQASTLICTSPNSVQLNSEAVESVTDESPYYGKDGYGVAW